MWNPEEAYRYLDEMIMEGTVASKGNETVEPISQNQDKPKKTAQIKESDSESEMSSDDEKEISTEDLIRLVQEKGDLLKKKHNEIKVMQEKVLRSYAEVENVMDRARREAESTKNFAVQSFSKSLLGVADNLSRASSVVKESFSEIDPSQDSSGAAPLLKTLLEGVAMTEKHLSDVFKKHGVERFDPINEEFDPHMHMAIFQVQDASKQPSSVAVVLKWIDLPPTSEMLHHLLPPNLAIKSLKVDCAQLGDSSIRHLANPQLEELCLRCCDNFTAELLFEIGRNCKNLRSLSLELGWLDEREDRPRTFIHNTGLEQLLRGCSRLESLCLTFDGSSFNNSKFAAIWRLVAPTLKVLELGYILAADAKEIFNSKILSSGGNIFGHSTLQMQEPKSAAFPNLQKLCLVLDWISDSVVGVISKNLPSLIHLDLRDEPIEEPRAAMDLTNWGIQQISSCSKLRHLSLVRSQEDFAISFRSVNDLGILLMAENCSNLESVRLGGFCRITDAGFRAILHQCSNLQKLELLRTTQLTNLVFHDISATSLFLTDVSLISCTLITDFSIIHLAYCKDIQVLDLKGCRRVGDDGLKVASSLGKLKTLHLNSSDISDVGLSYLGSGNSPLVSLSLRSWQRLTDKGISALVAGSLVQTLQNLDLSNIPNLIDNAILVLVKSGMQIMELRLRECPLIGDTSVIALASMHFQGRGYRSTLRLLDIYNSGGITRLAISWFKKPYFSRLRWLGIGSMDIWMCLEETGHYCEYYGKEMKLRDVKILLDRECEGTIIAEGPKERITRCMAI